MQKIFGYIHTHNIVTDSIFFVLGGILGITLVGGIIVTIFISIKNPVRENSVGEKIQHTGIKRILFWDPPWAFSDQTVQYLESQSSWWRIITVPVRIFKSLSNYHKAEYAFFLAPFAGMVFFILWLIKH